jgi:acyl carrier protein
VQVEELVVGRGIREVLVFATELPDAAGLSKLHALLDDNVDARIVILLMDEAELFLRPDPTALRAAVAEAMRPLAAILYGGGSGGMAEPSSAAAASRPVVPSGRGMAPDAVRGAVLGAVRSVLGLDDAAQLALDEPLMEQGLDSAAAVQLTDALMRALGVRLPGGTDGRTDGRAGRALISGAAPRQALGRPKSLAPRQLGDYSDFTEVPGAGVVWRRHVSIDVCLSAWCASRHTGL